MRRQEIILQIEKEIKSAENDIAKVRAEMPKPTLSMKAKRIEDINAAWTKIETLNKQIDALKIRLKQEREYEKIEQHEIAVWSTSNGKWLCQLSDSYKRYSIFENSGKYISNCPDEELSARFIDAIINLPASNESIHTSPQTSKALNTPNDARGARQSRNNEATILPGQKFHAQSNKMPAVWEVFERVKNETENIIRCRVIDGAFQERTYIGQQIGYLSDRESYASSRMK